ncbi:hypothetical protein G2W53_040513 [Senna tora]|uniref:Uncharacterized protein n=1 Tax=Senna tora TaxID=362788 RepID=A0A834SDL6_9FABA|nr:hypothetical protein G2W53_040513 [Senna tora]
MDITNTAVAATTITIVIITAVITTLNIKNSRCKRSTSAAEEKEGMICPTFVKSSAVRLLLEGRGQRSHRGRSEPRKFGISFTVPDRVSAEISDKKRVMGKHPLRICRVPLGGPCEFHKLVEEAKKESSPVSLKKMKKKVNLYHHKKAYHRSRFNDWYVEVIYSQDWDENEIEPQSSSSSDPNSSTM